MKCLKTIIYSRIMKIISTIIVFIGLFQLFLLATMVWPVKIIDLPPKLDIINERVYQGDYVVVKFHYKKYKSIPANVSIQLIDGYVMLYPTHTSNMPIGERDFVTTVLVPHYMPSGKYKLKVTLTYQLPLFKVVSYSTETDLFTIYQKQAIKGV